MADKTSIPLSLLTRAVYDPRLWSLEANARRLEIFEKVTVPTIRSQTFREFEWVLAVSPDDGLLDARVAAAREAGVEVATVSADIAEGSNRAQAAIAGYRAPWNDVIGSEGPRLTTRLDDDDGFAPTALERVVDRARVTQGRRSYQLPVGFRVYGGRYTKVRHRSNAMSTLFSPAGDSSTVYSFMHREIANHAKRVFVDDLPGWLWIRHPDTLSGWKRSTRPVTRALVNLFPIDWEFVGIDPVVDPVAGGESFK